EPGEGARAGQRGRRRRRPDAGGTVNFARMGMDRRIRPDAVLARPLLAESIMATHTILCAPRTALPADGVLTFEVDGVRGLIVRADGGVRAFSAVGRSAPRVGRAAVVDGRVLCPLHGWPIDPDDGRCRAAALCRYEPLAVEADAEKIRVRIPR